MANTTCSIDGCEKGGRIIAGMCGMHYARKRNTGSTELRSRFQDVDKRFWSNVEKTETCWNWTGYRNRSGYGVIGIGGSKGRNYLTHRWAWMQLIGEIPEGMQLDHICHNHACLNPEHLRLVTSKQNHEHKKGAQVNSTSGIRGVSWDKARGKWRAAVGHNGKHYGVGRFDSVEEAEAAVIAKRLELFTHNDWDRAA